MKNSSVVAQRFAYEGIMKEGGVLKVDVNKTMIDYVRRSHGEYTAALEKEKSRKTEGEKRQEERKRLSTELKQVVAAKKKAVENMNSVMSQHDSDIHALEEKLRAT